MRMASGSVSLDEHPRGYFVYDVTGASAHSDHEGTGPAAFSGGEAH